MVAKPEELTARQPVAPIDFTKDLQCPLLGLFGVVLAWFGKHLA